MRWIAWTLLALNFAVAGLLMGRGYLSQTRSGQDAPLNVDRLSLRGQSVASTKEPLLPVKTENEKLCVEWRGLNPAEYIQAREQLKAMAGEQVMSFIEVPLDTRRWVIFPPLPSPESAVSKLSELAAAGVQDAFVVKDAPWRNAISLGLYANDVAAMRRVHEVEAKGVLGTRVETLPRQGTEFYFVIRSESPEALKSLNGIKQAYPNSLQSRVACRA